MRPGWCYWPNSRRQLAHFSDDGHETLCGMRLGDSAAEAYQEHDQVRAFTTDATLRRCKLCAAELAR